MKKENVKVKMMRFLMTIFTFFVGTGIALGVPISGPIVNPGNGHSYLLLEQDSWINSEAEAITLGGHLVTINDATENDWVYDTFSSNRDLWIGFNDVASEGNFVWTSGETPIFTNWGPGEPNNVGNEDFAYILGVPFATISAREWNDIPNNPGALALYGVVEINAAGAPVPEPSTILLLGSGLIGLVGFNYKRNKKAA